MRRYKERFRRFLTGTPRLFAGTAALLVLGALLMGMMPVHDLVTVTDTEGNTVTLMTRLDDTGAILRLAGVSPGEHDKVVYRKSGENEAEVKVLRAFPVSLLADGEEYTARLAEGTVADLLKENGVALKGEDYVKPAADTPLTDGLQAVVHRVSYQEQSGIEEVPEEAVNAYIAKLPEGTAFRKSNGGVYSVTYRHRLVDGKVQKSEVLALSAVIMPRPAGTTGFTPGIPCSRIDRFGDIVMGPDGLPSSYQRVMKGAVTTAYSSSGGRGASGLGLYCGTVAVNPRVIPYGSKLFITDAAGNFVYGFAIATDTGTALMEGRVAIDLYFEVNAECLRFGKRTLDVYIL